MTYDARLLKLFSPKKGGRRRQAGRKREREDGREGFRDGRTENFVVHTRIKFQKNKVERIKKDVVRHA